MVDIDAAIRDVTEISKSKEGFKTDDLGGGVILLIPPGVDWPKKEIPANIEPRNMEYSGPR